MRLDFKTRAGRVGYLKLKGFTVDNNGTWKKENKIVPGYVLENWIWPKAFKLVVDDIDSRKEQSKNLHKEINKINNDVIDGAKNSKKHKTRGTFFEINYDIKDISRNTRGASEISEENLQNESSGETTTHKIKILKKAFFSENLSIERRDVLANIEEKNDMIEFSDLGNLSPSKHLRTVALTNRNITLTKNLKELYFDKCQICSEKLECGYKQYLVEVHHIKPLGGHCGADISENMIVLCPNHHAMFDRGAISIDINCKTAIHCNPENHMHNKQVVLKHQINQEYIDYHNQNIFIGTVGQKLDTNNNIKDVVSVVMVDYGDDIILCDIITNDVFNVKIEEKCNKVFMKPLEKILIGKAINDIFIYDDFQYKIIAINK